MGEGENRTRVSGSTYPHVAITLASPYILLYSTFHTAHSCIHPRIRTSINSFGDCYANHCTRRMYVNKNGPERSGRTITRGASNRCSTSRNFGRSYLFNTAEAEGIE